MKISIITPSFNSSKYIERAIQSVLNQNYDNWEHIIVDGGSIDGTVNILKKYDHLKWISEPDQGQSDAMNKGFKMSTGQIIGYLNADDYYEKDIFGKVCKEFSLNNTTMLIGDIHINRSGLSIEKRTASTKYSEIINYKKDLFPANPVGYFYKRSVQEKYGLFPVNNHTTMDLDFLFFCYKKFSVNYIPLVFGTFYLDGENKTSRMNVRNEQYKVLKEFLRHYDIFRYISIRLGEIKFQIKKALKALILSK